MIFDLDRRWTVAEATSLLWTQGISLRPHADGLYKLRRTPSPSTFAGFPRWAVVGIALWLAVLETADKLPQVLLAYPRYEAALADVKTKLMQPDIAKSQLDLNRQQTELANLQTQKTWTETQATKMQAFSAAASAYQNWGQAISNGNLSSSRNAQVFAHLDDLQPSDFTPYVPPLRPHLLIHLRHLRRPRPTMRCQHLRKCRRPRRVPARHPNLRRLRSLRPPPYSHPRRLLRHRQILLQLRLPLHLLPISQRNHPSHKPIRTEQRTGAIGKLGLRV